MENPCSSSDPSPASAPGGFGTETAWERAAAIGKVVFIGFPLKKACLFRRLCRDVSGRFRRWVILLFSWCGFLVSVVFRLVFSSSQARTTPRNV